MKLKQYRTYFLEKLTPLYDSMEAERFFAIALEELKGWKRSDLALNPDPPIGKTGHSSCPVWMIKGL
ncbi:hypothetical protein R1T16_09605 [Flavobacterium sp. DG1-102-2]|uniref:hypothetical protein n=1 Tax=Flavobacterium sp. DG1-102-2 TaxID=3081663 RepID=UPI002949CC8E|nr:hypothetical protein [Flavobacterium sp. DG1-102-2]MDV6168679.1 hypothetical protein [Flavobacterium sp. DG1-102-2]